MTYIHSLEKFICSKVNDLGYKLDSVKLEKCSIKELGDFQVNFAMKLAKEYKKNPREIAEEISESLKDKFDNVNIAGPGFINLSLKTDDLIDYANNEGNNFENFIDEKSDKTIIVDYGGANAAKALHVGHMRSANIGEALKRLCKLFNKKVIGDVHLGDLGRQAGMIISEIMINRPDLPFFDANYTGEYPKIDLTAKDLGIIYPKANTAAKNDEKRMDLVRQITAEIDKGNRGYTELWRQIVDISTPTIKEVYDTLNCHFELWEGELSSMKYVPSMLKIVEPHLYESDGALVMDVKKENDKILYFEQVFRTAYKSGLVKDSTKLYHFGFGTINGSDGKPFKTRDGGVMELSTLIDMLKQEVDKRIKEEITGEERKEILDKLTIATLKFTDLLPYRKTDYIFDPVKFSSLEGKTGPYVLYTVVRIKSLLNKVDTVEVKINSIPNDTIKDIILKVIDLPNILTSSYNEATLSYIVDYLYELCNLFNKFYNSYNVINEEDKKLKDTYIATCSLVYNIIHNLLDILAIDEVDKM